MTTPSVMSPDEVYPPKEGSLEARASLGLRIVAAIHLAGVILALVAVPNISTLLRVSFHGAGALLAILYLVTARAIDRRQPWAIAAVRPLLLVLIASGVVIVVQSVQKGVPQIPFDGIAALWALTGRPDVSLLRRFDQRSGSTLGSVALAISVMLFGAPIFDWGGALDHHEPDLRAAFSVDCGPAGKPAASIPIRYDWSFATPALLPNGFDEVVIGWTGDDAAGRPLYAVGAIPENAKGIYPGRLAEPSQGMVEQVKGESGASWQWGIEVAEQQLAPGRVELELERTATDVPAGGARLVVKATYVHLGIWRSDEVATCTW